jgi:hypothetical protein
MLIVNVAQHQYLTTYTPLNNAYHVGTKLIIIEIKGETI